jgi:hypothetical protein
MIYVSLLEVKMEMNANITVTYEIKRDCAIAQIVSRRLPTAAARGSSPCQVTWDLLSIKWH